MPSIHRRCPRLFVICLAADTHTVQILFKYYESFITRKDMQCHQVFTFTKMEQNCIVCNVPTKFSKPFKRLSLSFISGYMFLIFAIFPSSNSESLAEERIFDSLSVNVASTTHLVYLDDTPITATARVKPFQDSASELSFSSSSSGGILIYYLSESWLLAPFEYGLTKPFVQYLRQFMVFCRGPISLW